MPEYIERKKIEEAFENADPDVCESYPDQYSDWGYGIKLVQDLIRSIPSADVAPVVHGEWEWDTSDIYRCTVCNRKAHVKETMCQPAWQYCPNCGAKMDGGVSNNV